jgi:hypothetical protein
MRSRTSRRSVPIILSQMAFALGACGGLVRILMPSVWNTASKEPVNWPGIPDQELDCSGALIAFIRKLRAAGVVHVPCEFAAMLVR